MVRLFTFDGLGAVGTYRYNLNRGLQLFFKERDIIGKLFGELILGCDRCHGFVPPLDVDIDRFHGSGLDREGEIAGLLAVDLIGNAGTDGVEVVEDVAFHHDQLCHTVDHDGIAKSHKIDPATATLAACHCAIFMAEIADFLTGLVEKLGRERT